MGVRDPSSIAVGNAEVLWFTERGLSPAQRSALLPVPTKAEKIGIRPFALAYGTPNYGANVARRRSLGRCVRRSLRDVHPNQREQGAARDILPCPRRKLPQEGLHAGQLHGVCAGRTVA